MQRNFEPMRKQVEAWQRSELADVTAKVVTFEETAHKGALLKLAGLRVLTAHYCDLRPDSSHNCRVPVGIDANYRERLQSNGISISPPRT